MASPYAGQSGVSPIATIMLIGIVKSRKATPYSLTASGPSIRARINVSLANATAIDTCSTRKRNPALTSVMAMDQSTRAMEGRRSEALRNRNNPFMAIASAGGPAIATISAGTPWRDEMTTSSATRATRFRSVCRDVNEVRLLSGHPNLSCNAERQTHQKDEGKDQN